MFAGVLALVFAPPAGVFLVVADAHIAQIIRYTRSVAERIVVVPYGRAVELINAVFVLLVGKECAGNTGIPVLAELVNKIELGERINVSVLGDLAVFVPRGAREGVVL